MIGVNRMPTIRELREARNWSQMDLAYHAKVGISTVSKMERGVPVSRNVFERVCEVLGAEPQQVTGVQVKRSYRRSSHGA